MRKLVQKVVDINPSIESIPDRLQKFLNDMSRDGWEYCGQIGMFYIFKRWEEEVQVVQGGQNYGGNYQQNYNNYNPNQYKPYTPSFQQFNPQPTPQQYFNPNNFGVRVNPDEDKRTYGTNPFDE